MRLANRYLANAVFYDSNTPAFRRHVTIFPHLWVTIEGFRIDDRISLTFYTARDYTYISLLHTYTSVYSHVCIVVAW
jgi:hypothetical protein